MLEYAQTIGFDEIKKEGFLELIMQTAKSAAAGLSEGKPVREPIVGKRRAEIAVSAAVRSTGKALNQSSLDSVSRIKVRLASGREIAVFSKVSVRTGKLVFDLSRELLDAFAACAAEGYEFELPETVLIPKSGIAPDREASAYVRSMINAYLRAGLPMRRTEEFDFALLRCLMLFCLNGAALERAHSTATRAVLRALDGGAANKVGFAAMAAALKYAEGHSAKSK